MPASVGLLFFAPTIWREAYGAADSEVQVGTEADARREIAKMVGCGLRFGADLCLCPCFAVRLVRSNFWFGFYIIKHKWQEDRNETEAESIESEKTYAGRCEEFGGKEFVGENDCFAAPSSSTFASRFGYTEIEYHLNDQRR